VFWIVYVAASRGHDSMISNTTISDSEISEYSSASG
jgi:hypothetical protein